MTGKGRARRLRAAMLAVAPCLLAAGCGPGDIALEGKVFDMVGLNSANKPKVAKVAARAPLVVPPGLDALPKPGEGGQEVETASLGINDPDAAKTANKAELEKQQAAYCKEHYEIPKMRGDESADLAKGPLGYCRPSILTSGAALFGGGESDE